ncbi:hypothetical protein SDC9_122628 [bioreactor metagenome]|uniref:Uncharacterized protein n=1 Tax=bioreactor metagenome TaxID=1076179 RepID=A0A645CFD7_9ZZZZ
MDVGKASVGTQQLVFIKLLKAVFSDVAVAVIARRGGYKAVVCRVIPDVAVGFVVDLLFFGDDTGVTDDMAERFSVWIIAQCAIVCCIDGEAGDGEQPLLQVHRRLIRIERFEFDEVVTYFRQSGADVVLRHLHLRHGGNSAHELVHVGNRARHAEDGDRADVLRVRFAVGQNLAAVCLQHADAEAVAPLHLGEDQARRPVDGPALFNSIGFNREVVGQVLARALAVVGEAVVDARVDFAVEHVLGFVVDAGELQLVEDALVFLDELDLCDCLFQFVRGGFTVFPGDGRRGRRRIRVRRRGRRRVRVRRRGRRCVRVRGCVRVRRGRIGRRGGRIRRCRSIRRGRHVRVALVGGDVALVHCVRVGRRNALRQRRIAGGWVFARLRVRRHAVFFHGFRRVRGFGYRRIGYFRHRGARGGLRRRRGRFGLVQPKDLPPDFAVGFLFLLFFL